MTDIDRLKDETKAALEMLERAFPHKDATKPLSTRSTYQIIATITAVLNGKIKALEAVAKLFGGDNKDAPRWAGIWNQHRGYKAGDMVARNQGLFIAKANTAPGEQPAQSDQWQLILRGPK